MAVGADITVAPLTRALVPGATRALTRAFADDPGFAALWPDARRRAAALPRFLAMPLIEACATGHGEVLWAGGDVAGAAAWLPPGRYPYDLRQNLRAMPHVLGVAAAAPRTMPRLVRFGMNVEAAFPKDRPWYLYVVGVAPEAQGRGLGTQLLRPGLERCDAAGGDCYLETDTEAAARLYGKLGFEVLEAGAELLPGGPTHWRMRRPAGA